MRDFLQWLRAYASVYSRRAHNISRSKRLIIAAIVFALLIAALLGPIGTVVLVLVVLFVLPVIHTDIRREVDREYQKRK